MNKFVDSNIIVYAFTNNKLQEKCQRILKEENLVINTLVLLESYAKISTINKDEEFAQRVIRTLLNLDNITAVGFDNNLFFEAIKRNKKVRLKISDLVHYTTALLHNCEAIVSYDKKHFDSLDIKRIEP